MSGAVSNMQTAMPRPAFAGGAVGATGLGVLSSPNAAVDVTDHISRIGACGAYPMRTPSGWNPNTNSVSPIIQNYLFRSRSFVAGNGGYTEMRDDPYFTNEPRYTDVIRHIEGRGGALVSVGRFLPLTYGAWQRATHVYSVNKQSMIPLGLLPAYGGLLCMAKNQAQFFSMVFGRPLPEDHLKASYDEYSPQELMRFISSLSYDHSFSQTVSDSLIEPLTKGYGPTLKKIAGVTAERWLDVFRKDMAAGRCFPGGGASQTAILMTRDEAGRGGALASGDAFRMERELFLEQRVTGVVADMVNGGFDAVASHLRCKGERIGVVDVTNLEDIFLGAYLFKQKSPYHSEEEGREQYYGFYNALNSIRDKKGIIAVSAKGKKITSAEALSDFIRNAIPLDESPEVAVEAAKEFYRFRVDIVGAKEFQLAKRLRVFRRRTLGRVRFRVGMNIVKRMFEESPLEFDAVMKRLEDGFSGQVERWWLDMFVGNLVELGVVRRPAQSFLNKIDAR